MKIWYKLKNKFESEISKLMSSVKRPLMVTTLAWFYVSGGSAVITFEPMQPEPDPKRAGTCQQQTAEVH